MSYYSAARIFFLSLFVLSVISFGIFVRFLKTLFTLAALSMCVSLEIRICDDIASLQVSIQLVDTFTCALIIGCE